MHACIYTGLVTYNIELHHFRIGDEINIKGDKQAPIIELELLSIFFENLYTDFRSSSANVGIQLDTNILLALYNNHLYSHILEYMKYPNRAIHCTKFLTITIQDKVCYKACNAINFMK